MTTQPAPDVAHRVPSRAEHTLCTVFADTAERFADSPALQMSDGSRMLTWREWSERSSALARALGALGAGSGSTVVTLLSNRPEFYVADMAALMAGATAVALYNTSPPAEIAYILDNVDARVILTEEAYVPTLEAALAQSTVQPQLVVLAPDDDAALRALADSAPDEQSFDWRTASEDAVALIVNTSGTTGPPKAVQLSHRGLLLAWRAWADVAPGMWQVRSVVSYLPYAHLADRTFAYLAAIHSGATINCLADMRRIVDELRVMRPDMFVGVPRIWQKLAAALKADIPVGAVIDADLAKQLRERTGFESGAILWTGAAPIEVEIIEFFEAIGLPLIECYGMTETSGVIASNRPADRRNGTVGRPVVGAEVALAPDGEILVRGGLVMLGYRNEPEKSAETIDADGWLHTGDLASADDDGYLTIIGRKKEIMITAGGKNISPANIENTVKAATPLVGSVAVIADRRPYVSALITLDPEEAGRWATRLGYEGASASEVAEIPQIVAALEEAIATANGRLSRVEEIKRFRVLGDTWDAASGLVTPTLKLKRQRIADAYADLIEQIYTA